METTLKEGRKLLRARVKCLPESIKGKFATENAVWQEIKARHEFTDADFLVMMAIMQTPYHDSGKIEGLQSYDSSASACSFCASMLKAAEANDRIICGHCYDKAQEERWHNVKLRHGLQLEMIATVLIPHRYLALLDIYTEFFRFNSSGDVENSIQVANYYRMAKTHPETSCRLWSKNKAAVKYAKLLEPKPANCKNIYSVCEIDGHCEELPEDFDFYFVVASTPEKVAEYLAKGLNECNGKRCRACKFKCYDDKNGWKTGTGIVEILRD